MFELTTRAKLVALHTRMVAEQRTLLMQAAEAGTSPPWQTLRHVAYLESAILAVEAMIEERAG